MLITIPTDACDQLARHYPFFDTKRKLYYHNIQFIDRSSKEYQITQKAWKPRGTRQRRP